MSDQEIARTYLRHPTDLPRVGLLEEVGRGLIGGILAPFYFGLSALRGAPGLAIRRRCGLLGLRQLLLTKGRLPLLDIYKLLVYPMDSVRYFEFDFVWRAAADMTIHRYLDVSSPRLLPLLLVRERPDIRATLLNPDRNDLPITIRYADAMGISGRCAFTSELVDAANLQELSFDLVTCISVLEHIPEDGDAIRKMWSLVKPGGRLLITVPCSVKAVEEYIDQDKYGLLGVADDGFVFWQRYYDAKMLQTRVFSVIGDPTRVSVYGERTAGLYADNVQQKMRRGRRYPGWREPYIVTRDYRFFDSIMSLPGMGVIGLEFRKDPGTASAPGTDSLRQDRDR